MVNNARQILGDSEKITGRWNKDDRGKVNALCSENIEWLEKNTDASFQQIEEQKEEFKHRLDPYLSKLRH